MSVTMNTWPNISYDLDGGSMSPWVSLDVSGTLSE